MVVGIAMVVLTICMVLPVLAARGHETQADSEYAKRLALMTESLFRQQESLVDNMKRQQQMIESMNQQQQNLVDNINRQQKAMVENTERLTTKVDDLTERVTQLDKGQDIQGGAKKRVLLHNDLSVLNAIHSLEQKMSNLQSSSGSGSIYTRWGRSHCPGNGTDLVYAGYAAGSNYGQTGGGSNYLCLPSDPIWGYTVSGHQSGAEVYGAEYDNGQYSPSQLSQFYGSAAMNDDMACAVCRSSRPSSLMIPGRNVCYPGWSMEYSGYLMAEPSDFYSSDFICLDGASEAVPHGRDDKNGALFVVAEVNCGSLACPPYIDGHELTCVTCTK